MQTTTDNDNSSDLERKPLASDSFRVRCPHCRKLYLVQLNDVHEAKPRFECVQCHSRFWLMMGDLDFREEITGVPLQLKGTALKSQVSKSSSTVVQTKPCPKCQKSMAVNAAECIHCGVIFEKLKELAARESLPPHSEGVAGAWRKVIEDYGNEAVHVAFIQMAHRENALAYAGAQYNQLSMLMPADETARRHIREVQALGSMMLPDRDKDKKAYASIPYSRVWQVPLAAAVIMMVVGIFLPVFRNMVGVGAAIFFIALALRFQQRPR